MTASLAYGLEYPIRPEWRSGLRKCSNDMTGITNGPTKEVSGLSRHSRLHIVRDLTAKAPSHSAEQLMRSKIHRAPGSEPAGPQRAPWICHHKSKQISDGDEPAWMRITVWAMVFETALAIITAACWKLWVLLH
jgi:hypothetical protein